MNVCGDCSWRSINSLCRRTGSHKCNTTEPACPMFSDPDDPIVQHAIHYWNAIGSILVDLSILLSINDNISNISVKK